MATGINMTEAALNSFVKKYGDERRASTLDASEPVVGTKLGLVNRKLAKRAIASDSDLSHLQAQCSDWTATTAQEVVLSYANFHKAIVNGADFNGSLLNDARLTYASFKGATLGHCDMRDVNAEDAVFSKAFMRHANLTKGNFRDANFDGADMGHANAYGANFRDASFVGADLSNVQFDGARLDHCNFEDAKIEGASFSKASVIGCKGLLQFGPVGAEGRIGYVVRHRSGPMVKLGCFWGTQEEALRAIDGRYGPGYADSYKLMVMAAGLAAMMPDWKLASYGDNTDKLTGGEIERAFTRSTERRCNPAVNEEFMGLAYRIQDFFRVMPSRLSRPAKADPVVADTNVEGS